MATSDKRLRQQTSQSHPGYSVNNDPNRTPYNSFSSFKYIDNTVVSAYEVGIANGISGKSTPTSKNRDLPVPRARKTLAGKPPSGAKLEYKPVGTVTKSKSLTEINTINKRGNKIPDSYAQRFDNRSNRHPEQTSQDYSVLDVNIDDIHAGVSYSTHTTGTEGRSVIQRPDKNDGSTVNSVKETSSLNSDINCRSDDYKQVNSESERLSISTIQNSDGLIKDGVIDIDSPNKTLDNNVLVDNVVTVPLYCTDNTFVSPHCDKTRKDDSLRLFHCQNNNSIQQAEANKLNKNHQSSERRHSLNDGISLFSSNLVQVDSGNYYRSRLDHSGSGKRYSRRRHLSLQQPPKTDKHSETAHVHVTNSGLSRNDSEYLQPANHSGTSRRKLPQVPAKTPTLSVNKMGDQDSLGHNNNPDELDSGGSVINDTLRDTQLDSQTMQVKHHISSQQENAIIYSNSSEDKPQCSNVCDTTSPNGVEANDMKSQQSNLKSNRVSKVTDRDLNLAKVATLKTHPIQGLPSHKESLKDQILIWKRETAGNHESAASVNSIVKHSLSQNDLSVLKSKKTRTKPNESGNIEDKFRNKLKEIVASGSVKNVKKPKATGRKNVNITPENKHSGSEQHILNIMNSSAEENSDLQYKTSTKDDSANNDIHVEDSGNVSDVNNDKVVKELPVGSIFSFNQDVIQELTDLVMTKPDSVMTNQNHGVIQHDPVLIKEDSVKINAGAVGQSNPQTVNETQHNVSNLNAKETINSDIPVVSERNEIDVKGLDRNQDHCIDRTKRGETELQKIVDFNQYQKLDLEGRSFDGKEVLDQPIPVTEDLRERANDSGGNDSAIKNHMSTINTQASKPTANKIQTDLSQKQGHILRTPSYRKRVMARAKLRYSKKSQNFKECSCVKKENGELEQCSFCQSYEIKKRSQTSLGHPALSEFSESECSDIASPRRALTPEMTGSRSVDQGHSSPRSVRKVNVSPRVDVLLSSNLFKKHLQKHENLLQKHTMSYKRFGMNKSVSNLDLSEGFTVDSESSYLDNASEISEPASLHDLLDDGLNKSIDFTKSSDRTTTNRRHSLTGDSDIQFSDFDLKAMRRKKSGDTLPSSFSKPKSRPGLGRLFDNVRNRNQSRNNIPSFHEFRKQKERHIATKDSKHDLASVDSSMKEVVDTDVNDTDVKDQCHDLDKSDHDLQTVLETDERGSKENLLGDVTDGDSKQASVKESPFPATPSVKTEISVGHSEVVIAEADTSQCAGLISKQRPRSKTKSRTLPNIDVSAMSDNSSEPSSSQSVTSQKRRISGKRPRSVISKKSNVDSDTPDTSEKDNSNRQNVSARPKLKGHGRRIIRSESDSKYETEKGKNTDEFVDLKLKGVHSRHLSLLGKGNNSVSFNLESAMNDGASDVSSSITESVLSDSLYSEPYVNETITSIYDTDDFTDGSTNDVSAAIIDDPSAPVLRSTSDACEITHEAARKRRERKERPYKSDPFSGTEIIPASRRCAIREEKARLRDHLSFASSSKEEILSFLDGVSQSDLEHCTSFPSLEEISEDEHKSVEDRQTSVELMRKLGKHPSNVSSLSTDSGVIGQEESHDSKQSSPTNTLTHSVSEHQPTWQQAQHATKRPYSTSCSDLSAIKNQGCSNCNNDVHHSTPTNFLCPRCEQRQIERKKIIQEVIDTEVNYGRDLKILLEEFYKPMLKAGLLTKDQLDCIFLNLDELLHVNVHFITKLKAAINYSNQHSDEDLKDVMVGSLFLESSTMFLTFENYCVNQAQAPILLEQLEREKELLRIFLHVSQSDNHLLRRMHLKSFLMVPVQRIMKYPLLLDRLYKVTLDKHKDKEALREAKEKIEDILGHINAPNFTEKENDQNTSININNNNNNNNNNSKNNNNNTNSNISNSVHVVSAAVVLIKEKNGRYQVAREPFMLEKCVVSQDPEFMEVFELLEWNRESCLIKAENPMETKTWVQHLRRQMQNLGCWRKRRNALPNILLNHLSS